MTTKKTIIGLYRDNFKTFVSYVSGIYVINSWRIYIKQKIKMIAVSSAIISVSITEKIKSRMLFIENLITLISRNELIETIPSPTIYLAAKEIQRIVQIISIKPKIEWGMSETGKTSSNILVSKNKIIFTVQIGNFFFLSDWDSDTLGTLDSYTLGDMDFVSA